MIRPALLAFLFLPISLPAQEAVDLEVVHRIRQEAYEHSEVMDHLFQPVDVHGPRITGSPGAGKSTLIRILLGEQTPDSGVVRIGSNVHAGHFSQTHEGIDPDQPVYRFIQNVILKEAPDRALSEQAARDLAGAFMFSGSEQDRDMGTLSGGERARAVLASLVASSKNLLVLDEPTNHLDIPSAERLEEVLSDEEGYAGTLILISHDRAIIDATCDHLIVLDGSGGAELFVGNYTDWHKRELTRKRDSEQREAQARMNREKDEKKKRQAVHKEREKSKSSKGPSASGLARLKTEQIEERIEKIETRIKQLDKQLSNPDVWQNHKKADKLGNERATLVAELEPLEFEWTNRAGT